MATQHEGTVNKVDMEVLQEIRDCMTLIRQNAQRMLDVEAALRNNPKSVNMMAAMYERLRQRQRDFAIMLRMMQLVETTYLKGGDWLAQHQRYRDFLKKFDRKYIKVDQTLTSMMARTRQA